MTSPVAFILGAGPGIGKAVGQMLVKNGYKVALGSRSPSKDASNDFLPVKLDVTKTETIAAAFKTVEDKLGAPANVVVFNAATFAPLPTPGDPLSLPTPSFADSLAVGSGVFDAARHALAGFRALTPTPDGAALPKLFIVTGNVAPFLPPSAQWTTIQSQKVVGAYLVELFSNSYADEGARFYFASQVGTSGDPPGKEFNGHAHAVAYERLLKAKDRGYWDQRFIADGSTWEKP